MQRTLLTGVDNISCSDFRKVQTESSTGSTSSNKVRTTLTIHVEAIDFDTQACVLRVKGRNIQENQYVKVRNVLVCEKFKGVLLSLKSNIFKNINNPEFIFNSKMCYVRNVVTWKTVHEKKILKLSELFQIFSYSLLIGSQITNEFHM